MNYISVSLYRKVIEHALTEGMTIEDFSDLPVPYRSLHEVQAVPADDFFELHEKLDQLPTLEYL